MAPGRTFIGVAVMLLVTVFPALAAPPPNDYYSNRIAITSSPMVVTGSLAGATLERFPTACDGEWWNESTYNGFPTGSVWWSISPTNACAVTVEILSVGSDSQEIEQVSVVSPFSHPIFNNPDCWRFAFVNSITAFTGKRPYVTAKAYCPTNFAVQLTGVSTSVVLRFTMHTEPLLIIAPQSRTVSPGQAVFFGVAATGHSPLQYQWLHNGVAMEGETFPILCFEEVDPTNAGTYQVIVSDDLGTNSAEVTLTVRETDVAPRWLEIKRLASNEWSGRLKVEAGRSYRLEVSTNLIDWSPLTTVVQESSVKHGTADVVHGGVWVSAVRTGGVVFLPRTKSEVRFKSEASGSFFRAARYDPANSLCLGNLKKVRFAKELWAYSHRIFGEFGGVYPHTESWFPKYPSFGPGIDWFTHSELSAFMRPTPSLTGIVLRAHTPYSGTTANRIVRRISCWNPTGDATTSPLARRPSPPRRWGAVSSPLRACVHPNHRASFTRGALRTARPTQACARFPGSARGPGHAEVLRESRDVVRAAAK